MGDSAPRTSSVLQERLSRLQELQRSLPTQPYSVVLRLKLSKAYKSLGYPDLAAGEAYKALLLVDEVVDEGEYHEQALETASADVEADTTRHRKPQSSSGSDEEYLHMKCCCQMDKDEESSNDDAVVLWAKDCWSRDAFDLLIDSLIDCGCLRSASEYISRATRSFGSTANFAAHQEKLTRAIRTHPESKEEDPETLDVQDYPDKGLVRRELYPWNTHEPDRFSTESIQFLNEQMRDIAPKLEVKATELPSLLTTGSDDKSSTQTLTTVKQLGVFAKDNAAPGEAVLQEKSILTAVARLSESFCDACSASLPDTRSAGAGEGSTITCEECDEAFYCSEECYDLAQANYHPAVCGASIDLHAASASEAADSLYALLLVRALALAETRELHPLDLKEVRFIWGDYRSLDICQYLEAGTKGGLLDPFGGVPRTLPFSFKHNITTPLHVLEKMDVNIYEQNHRYDFWVFNTLYAKFRGTASARQGLDGRPEIGAVHPMWCLANHSCDPNVAWEWQGSMRFWAREKLVEWEGRDPGRRPGLRSGEEVFSHYCDIRLPVQERREWAVGALGGECMCPRCVWESAGGRE